jgi:hypothetical protein
LSPIVKRDATYSGREDLKKKKEEEKEEIDARRSLMSLRRERPRAGRPHSHAMDKPANHQGHREADFAGTNPHVGRPLSL